MAIKKAFAYYELDGKEFGPHRVGLQTKLQYEKTAKVRGWDADKSPFTTSLFWAWHAGQAEHGLSFEDFSARVLDVAVVNDDGDEEGLDLDPTLTAPTNA